MPVLLEALLWTSLIAGVGAVALGLWDGARDDD